jgi:glycerol-3-phosphate acyltransferase PlsX
MKNSKPRIAVDAMGGDHGPSCLIPGALAAAREQDMSLIFVGRQQALRTELRRHDTGGQDVQIVHASDVAEMGDKPSHILRRKKNTSIQVCCNLIKEGRADGLLSAGHTGVTLASGMFSLGRLKGVERPGLAALLPRENKPLILIDVGANVDSKPRHLVQFSIMADALAKTVLKEESPRIALLNIGEERGKGNVQVNEAYDLLSHTSLNFVGNVEGRELFGTDVDIAVCDGFVGNIALKLSEGLGEAFSSMLRKEMRDGLFTRIGARIALPAFRRFSRKLDYEEYGGAPLLGLNGTVFVCHGGAGMKGVRQSTAMAATFISCRANDEIRKGLEAHPEMTRFQKIKKMLHTSRGHSEQEAEQGHGKEQSPGKEQGQETEQGPEQSNP